MVRTYEPLPPPGGGKVPDLLGRERVARKVLHPGAHHHLVGGGRWGVGWPSLYRQSTQQTSSLAFLAARQMPEAPAAGNTSVILGAVLYTVTDPRPLGRRTQ